MENKEKITAIIKKIKFKSLKELEKEVFSSIEELEEKLKKLGFSFFYIWKTKYRKDLFLKGKINPFSISVRHNISFTEAVITIGCKDTIVVKL